MKNVILALLLSTNLAFAQTVTPSGSGGSGTPGGTNGQIQFNNAGAFGGVTPAFAAGCSGVVAGSSLSITYSTQQVSVSHASGDTINGNECGQLGTYNSGSAIAITLPQAGSGLFVNGWYEDHTNYGAGIVTFTTAAGTFLSAGTPSTYAITQGQGVRLTASTVSPGNWDVSNTGIGQSISLPLAAASGGTGVANTGGKNITLGAAFTTTGAGAPTLAFPAGSQTYTFPNASSTIVDLSSTQTLTGKSFDASSIFTGQVALNRGGTNADLSATGGTSQFLKQATVGAAITVVRPVCADLSDSSTGCTANLASPPAIGNTTPSTGAFTTLGATGQITSTLAIGTAPFVITSTTNVANLNASSLNGSVIGTSGATIPLLSTTNTWTLSQTFSGLISGTGGTLLTANTASINSPLSFRNTSANAAAGTAMNMGNNTSSTEVMLQLNSSANTTVGANSNGTSSLTLNNTEATNTGGIYFQTANTNAITISKTQAVGLPGIASSSAAQTGTVCWTTGGGNLTVDTTVACLASLEELKNIKGPIVGALDEVLALKPFWYSWKDVDHYKMDPHDQPGLGAHQVESIDSRLAGYNPEGKLIGVRYQQMVAVLVAAIQEQQQEIDALKIKIMQVGIQ